MNIITIQKGNPYVATVTLTSNGLPYDLTGRTVFFTVKLVNDFTSNDVSALITETITTHVPPASAGVTTLDLSATQTDVPTGEYKGDFRVYLGGVIQANTETFTVIVTDIVTIGTGTIEVGVDQGVVCDSNYATLADANTAATAAGRELIITTSHTIDDLTLTTPVRILPGGSISVNLTKTLTISKSFNAGLYQVFAGTGTVTFGVNSVKQVYPQWWGAVADGVTDDTDALQSAIDSYGNVYIPTGEYLYTTALSIPESTHIIGAGADLTILMPSSCNGLEYQHSSSTSPVNIRDFTIDGGSNTTGIGIRYLGTADNLERIWGGRISNVRIQNINTAVYLRTANNIEISGCRFWKVYHGIKIIGQVIVGRFHDNDVEYDSAMGVGISYGFYVDSAFDYDPGGVTEHTPEDIQCHDNRFFGFDIGAYLYRVLYINIERNDFDYCNDYGIYGSTLTGNCVIRGNWVSMAHIDAVAGIFLDVRGALAYKTTVVRENVVNAVVVTTACNGIQVKALQNSVLIDANNFYGFSSADIYINDVVDIAITNNYCYSNVAYSLLLHPFVVGKTNGHIKVDGNYFRGSFYTYPTNVDADIDMGFNNGLYSTRIKGKVLIDTNLTSGAINYTNIRPTPANIPADTTGFTPKLIIYGPEINLGYVWGTATETGVTINCSSVSHAATYVYWEVVLMQLAITLS